MKKKYDAFISYNNTDYVFALQIAEELKAAGLRVWFDKWELKPGLTFMEGLIDGIKNSNSVLFLLGPAGIGNWERTEINQALQEQSERRCRLIPVLLPGADENIELPPFINHHPIVDCRSQQTSEEQLNRLIWGITDRKPYKAVSQVGTSFSLAIPNPKSGSTFRRIYTLPNPKSDRQLDVNWGTFGFGVEILHKQIKNYGHGLNIDACLGINDAGLIMATFMNSSVCGRKKLGWIKCEKSAEITTISSDSFFPNLNDNATILLTDFEVKTVNVLGIIITRLKEVYKNPHFFFATFGAMTDSPDLVIDKFDDLVSANNLKSLKLDDIFIAFTMHHPGIEPPFELK